MADDGGILFRPGTAAIAPCTAVALLTAAARRLSCSIDVDDALNSLTRPWHGYSIDPCTALETPALAWRVHVAFLRPWHGYPIGPGILAIFLFVLACTDHRASSAMVWLMLDLGTTVGLPTVPGASADHGPWSSERRPTLASLA